MAKSWSYTWLNSGLTTKVRGFSEIWPWKFPLLQWAREVCLRIPEHAGVVK